MVIAGAAATADGVIGSHRLGTMPALRGEHGSVRELVPLANAHGFYWGGHFSRRDGDALRSDETGVAYR
jgi:hypothetical protein